MAKKYDVTAIGELLVDFTDSGMSQQGNKLMEANPGGAPCNVLAMLCNLGFRTAFIGKVGDDMFGRMLRDNAVEAGIDVSGLKLDSRYNTTLAFVEKKSDGDRDFAFYRREGADLMLDESEIDESLIRESKVVHFGTLSMSGEIAEAATKKAITIAKESGCLITFDPNYRAPLWDSVEKAKEKIAWGMSVCDVLKISDNEIELMTGLTDYEKGARQLKEQYDIPIVFATLGPEGSMVLSGDNVVRVPAFINKGTVETTGAGDTFMGCVIGYILRMAGVAGAVAEGNTGMVGYTMEWDRQHALMDMDSFHLSDMLTYANAAASIITTRRGAMMVMPTRDEITVFIINHLE
ncbi:MAG: carbohydrate kinase [Lachnospiraceae bacterium]|nr:carbohydrate kinase [Lachnospiraceae bacterium]